MTEPFEPFADERANFFGAAEETRQTFDLVLWLALFAGQADVVDKRDQMRDLGSCHILEEDQQVEKVRKEILALSEVFDEASNIFVEGAWFVGARLLDRNEYWRHTRDSAARPCHVSPRRVVEALQMLILLLHWFKDGLKRTID
jgi:hypothetical protein